ncbi:MAG: signal peptidase II [Pseudomonadota bacterium]
MNRRFGTALAVIAALVVGDQLIKWLVETYMAFQQPIQLLPFFSLYRTHNFGIAFSMFSGQSPLMLIIVALAVTGFVSWLWATSPKDHWIAHAGFALIIGGAIGNLIDRIRLGYVVDYFLFHLPNWSFAVFNLADTAITVGAGLVLLNEFLTWRRTKAATKD